MTKEEAIKIFKHKIETMERGAICCDYGIDKDAFALAIQVLKQDQKTGHWILKRTFPTKLYNEYLNEYKCSECYREIRCTESQLVNYPYCHCGAKMIDEQKSEVEK